MSLSSLLFIKLACRVYEDESADCREMASNCILAIIKRIRDTKEEKELFEITTNWLNENKVLYITFFNEIQCTLQEFVLYDFVMISADSVS